MNIDVSSDLTALPGALPFIVALLKVTFVLLVALGLSRLLRRASAGSRHLVWLVALCALLALPPIAAWGPLALPVLPSVDATVATTPLPEGASGMTKGHDVQQDARSEHPAGRSSAASPSTSPLPVGTMMLWGWAVVTLALLARLMYGAWLVRRIVRRSIPLEESAWQTPLFEIADRLGLDAAPRLLRSDDVKMPFAAGLMSPVIVLPADSEGWSAERRSAVLIHELGHVRRRDLLGHTLGRLACALYWFHPLVWTAARELRAESERACDDLALAFGTRPSDYAEHLLEIVSSVRDHRTPAVALALAHRREFEGRMLAILDPGLRRLAPGRIQSAALVGSVALLAVLVSAASPVPRGVLPKATHDEMPVAIGALEQREIEEEASAPASALPAAKPAVQRKPAPRLDVESIIKAEAADSGHDRAAVLARLVRTDASAEVRRVAAWGLQRYIEQDVAIDALVAALGSDKDAEVREMAAWALAGTRRNASAGAALTKALRQDRDPAVRATLVWAIGATRTCGDVEALLGMLRDASAEVREVAAWSVGACRPERAPAALIQALGDSAPDVRHSVAWALYTIRDPAAVGAIDAAFRRETDAEVQEGLIHALGACGEPSVEALQRLITSPDSTVRMLAVTTLAKADGLGPWPWPRPEPRPYP
jgi:beta-lactamase regulating signal transducer with metallopeptidase domain/HEAT repeat protein